MVAQRRPALAREGPERPAATMPPTVPSAVEAGRLEGQVLALCAASRASPARLRGVAALHRHHQLAGLVGC